ncbi:MAG: serine hydrolase domain-containing protein [Bacteroidota bacterium]
MTPQRSAELNRAFPLLMRKHEVLTAGVGILRAGELEWAGYFGDQSPGVPASERTQFNAASLTKTVTAEAILRLVAAGRISLDEPMAPHWVDPDLAGEERVARVTPRMVLTHSTGLPNWRFLDDNTGGYAGDLPLRFLFEPGTSYSYSGEAFQYVARFTEEKLNVGFEDLIEEYVFGPIGMEEAAFSRRKANFPNIVRAVDAEGTFHGHYCTPWDCREEGEWSAAGGLRVTVPDFAAFLGAVFRRDGYEAILADERDRVHVEQWNRRRSVLVRCERLEETSCPHAQGYGLGWQVAEYPGYEILAHRGSDWSEAALTYVYTDSGDGLLLFLNAPTARALAMMPEAIELLHPGSPVATHYRYE